MTNAQITPNDVADDILDIDESTPSLINHVNRSSLIGIAGVLAGVCFLVAANVLGTKFGRSGLWITMWRSFFAAALLAIYVKIRKQNITFESIKYCIAPCLAFTVHIICFYQAIQDTTLTNVVIIRSLQPPLVLLFVGSQFSEKIKASNVIAAISATAGVVLTVWGSTITGSNSVRGDLLAVCALFAWIALFIFTKKARQHVGTASFMFLTTSLSGIVATIIVPFTSESILPHSNELIKLVAMAICASLGHGFISWAHKHTKLSTASLLTLLTPVGSTICAAIFFDQRITLLIAIGVTVVMGSVATVIKTDRIETKQKQDLRLDKAKVA
ncbi:MAG: DMT family transporter [Acidimicrobiia bacterium]